MTVAIYDDLTVATSPEVRDQLLTDFLVATRHLDRPAYFAALREDQQRDIVRALATRHNSGIDEEHIAFLARALATEDW